MKSKNPSITPGTVVVFEPLNFNQEWWKSQKEADLIKWYSSLGYGQEKRKFFVFMYEILVGNEPTGHCILISLDDQTIEIMRHVSDFRPVTDEEF
jgi:hypothetical protein